MSPRILIALLALLLVGCPTGPRGDDDGDDDDGTGDDDDATPPDEGDPIDSDFAAALETTLSNAQEDYGPPGIQVAVKVPGHTVWTSASGSLATTDRLKVGGIGQMFLATAMLQLQEEGELPLSDVIDLHYPGLSWGGGPTISQILNHNSGVPDYIDHSDFNWDATWQPEELAAMASEFSPVNAPGADFFWSHANYVVASLVLEEVAGRSWEEELDNRFFEPLGLNSTRLPEVGDGWSGVAPGYAGGDDVTGANDPSAYGAAGNLESNAADLARWGSELFGGDLLSGESRWEMYGHPFTASNDYAWGLGVLSTGFGPGQAPQVGNMGSVEGYTSWLGYREDLDVSIAVLANGWTDSQGGNYSQWIANEFWAVAQNHVDPSGDDDDDDDDDDFVPLAEPAGQMRLHVYDLLPLAAPAAAPGHDAVALTGWWDYDNDGGTIGYFTFTSADFSSGTPQGAVVCDLQANGTYDPSDDTYDITGTLQFDSWEGASCDGWDTFEQWHDLFLFGLSGLRLVPIEQVPEGWNIQGSIDSWAATAPGGAQVSFVILADMPAIASAHKQTPPYAVLGHYWQLPGDL